MVRAGRNGALVNELEVVETGVRAAFIRDQPGVVNAARKDFHQRNWETRGQVKELVTGEVSVLAAGEDFLTNVAMLINSGDVPPGAQDIKMGGAPDV